LGYYDVKKFVFVQNVNMEKVITPFSHQQKIEKKEANNCHLFFVIG